MTSLAHDDHRRNPGQTRPSIFADRIVLAILVLSIAAALGLAAVAMLADLPADLPALIPFDQPAALSGFTA